MKPSLRMLIVILLIAVWTTPCAFALDNNEGDNAQPLATKIKKVEKPLVLDQAASAEKVRYSFWATRKLSTNDTKRDIRQQVAEDNQENLIFKTPH